VDAPIESNQRRHRLSLVRTAGHVEKTSSANAPKPLGFERQAQPALALRVSADQAERLVVFPDLRQPRRRQRESGLARDLLGRPAVKPSMATPRREQMS